MANYVKTAILMGALTLLILFIGSFFGPNGLTVALIFAGLMNFVSYYFSDRIALSMYGAEAVTREQTPDLYRIVESLTVRAGIPMPKIFIIPNESPNAFATGRNPEHASVAVTQGILRSLSRDELEGVLAHEIGHVINRDILISTIVATMAGAIMYLTTMLKWGMIFGGAGRERDDESPMGGFGFLLAVILAPIAATIIQLAISRSREYGADSTGAHLIGTPYPLANALQKLDQASKQIPLAASPETAHMFIVQPLTGGGGLGLLMNIFSTHPPIEKRIARLLGRSA
ncbi:MAG: zinc metalloprotease HtpX [Acidobacteria bacterium]|nr:zinc metalloprotease HtpX [Acidobacteriota bacterium]MBI3655257.1 zinc metalloprotease HtpX [Acidobacteriota bacterium]